MSSIGDKPINGVKCVVENCVHHTSENGCTACCINVGGHDARAINETDCETFSKRECCN